MESKYKDNIEYIGDVGSDPVTGNILTTLTMYDTTKEFADLWTQGQPIELLPLRYQMEISQPRIDVTAASYCSSTFPSGYNQV